MSCAEAWALILLAAAAALGDLSPPQNLTLQTLNTQYVLHWDWADHRQTDMDGTVTFTAQCLPAVYARKPPHKQVWQTVCADVSERRCDFTHAEMHYVGMYVLRVRASTTQQFSNWTNVNFCPDKDADLGPPSSVKLSAVKGDLEIVITDALTSSNESMKEQDSQLYYLIQYWRQEEGSQKAKVLKTKNNVVMLSELNGWTWYCVRVQARSDFYNKMSVFSDTHCSLTEGPTPYWHILLYFLLSLVICFLLVMLVWFSFYKVYTSFKSVFFPNINLPSHIQELLLSDPEMPRLLPPKSPESVCEHLDVISVEMDAVMDVESSNPEDQDTSAPRRHGSGDSGFNSTEEDFRHRQNESSCDSTDSGIQIDDLRKVKTERANKLHDGMPELCI